MRLEVGKTILNLTGSMLKVAHTRSAGQGLGISAGNEMILSRPLGVFGNKK